MNIFEPQSSATSKHTAKGAPLRLLQIIEDYLSFYASASSHTAKAKRADLETFLIFMEKHSGDKRDQLSLEDWSYSTVQRFVEHCLARSEAPATVSRRLATLKHLGRVLAERVPGFINPARDVKAPQINAVKPRALTPEQIEQVRQTARERLGEKPGFIRSRNLMLLELMLETGLRAEEVRLLRISQFDEGGEWIRQVRTKGRRFRNVYIPERVRERLREYNQLRALELKRFFAALTIAQDKKLPLFISTYRCSPKDLDSFLMSAKTLWRSISQLSRELRLHPHLLRHSFAIDLLDSSNDIRLVSQALGHSDVRVTMRYTERRDTEIAAALERRKKRPS